MEVVKDEGLVVAVLDVLELRLTLEGTEEETDDESVPPPHAERARGTAKSRRSSFFILIFLGFCLREQGDSGASKE
ncbi:hypothetical protein CFL01nite_20390 [Corynebacterium flavescens]|uniref:Uncharacterized protein n=1 Tax=Corynebacterium flavescens TaxID=28028 RepID=A0AB73B9Q2_CORFL|nr:hypothetical protein CFL01nite_20390 [Corynebacterium flavescens]HCG46231.1 hypothetical protein [Corynebacterium flavescens]